VRAAEIVDRLRGSEGGGGGGGGGVEDGSLAVEVNRPQEVAEMPEGAGVGP
jgi:hypothetical protein